MNVFQRGGNIYDTDLFMLSQSYLYSRMAFGNGRLSHNVMFVFNIFANSRLQSTIGQLVSHDMLLGRWRLALDLFGRVFCDDVGAEPGSIVSELGGFPVKESRFRREMEKLRNNAQQRDLVLEVSVLVDRGNECDDRSCK